MIRARQLGLAGTLAASVASLFLPALPAWAGGTPTGNEAITTPVKVPAGTLVGTQAWTPPVDPNANPIDGTPATTITGVGYDTGGSVAGMVCDGNPPTSPGWSPAGDCDPLTSTTLLFTGSNGNPPGQVTLNFNQATIVPAFRGDGPNDQFNCLAPADDPNASQVNLENSGGTPAPINSANPSWGASTVGASGGGTAPCTIRVGYSTVNLSTTADKFFPLALPQVAPVSITVPGAPTLVSASPGNANVNVSWTAPTDTGNAPSIGYVVTASPGGATCFTSGATSCTVTGLTNGTTYTFTVTATNSAGTSAASSPSNPAIPFGPPGAPTGVKATAGAGAATVSWTAPASDGGSPITGYVVTASPGGATWSTGGATSCTVTGLTNGTAYTFTVKAENPASFGPPSAPSAAVTPMGTVPPPPPQPGGGAKGSDAGYWEVASDGGVFSFGQALFHGSMGGTVLNKPIVGVAATPSGRGYWEVASDGGLFSFGDAGFFGSMGGTALNEPIVGVAATPSGRGYWQVASDGGVFSFGDAGFFGSMGGAVLEKPIVGIAATPDGRGYWEVASDGGLFAFGDAEFFGSMGGKPLNEPIVGVAATPEGKGYWEVAADGGLFAFGDARFFGSMGGKPLNEPIVGIASTPNGEGYTEVASDGGLFAFGNASFYGSTGAIRLNKPVIGMADVA